MRYHGRDLVFVDTAGLRRQAKIDESLEYYSMLRTEIAIERADICLLLVDGLVVAWTMLFSEAQETAGR